MAILTGQLSTLESTTLDEIETIRCVSKWFILTLKNAKSRVGQSQVCNLRTTHYSVLKFDLFVALSSLHHSQLHFILIPLLW